MAKLVFADCETDGLDAKVIHCLCVKTPEGCLDILDKESLHRFLQDYKPDKWVFHNGLGFDVWVLNRIWGAGINPLNVIDTAVVSRLVDYNKFNTHSLKELGQFLGVFKGDFTGPWDTFTQEMLEYCRQDVEVLEAIFKYYLPQIRSPDWAKAMRIEHDMAIICQDMHNNGFGFDKDEAEVILSDVKTSMATLEKSFQQAYPPKLVEVNRIKYRVRKDGELFSSVTDAMARYPLTRQEGDDLVCFDYEAFNPASSKHRIDVLWDAGWKPFTKTKGYKKWLRQNSGS